MIDDDRIYLIIRENIRTLREKHPKTEKKTTQAKLAEAVGIERSTLTNIELGNQRPPVHVLYRLCDYFGISLNELIPQLSDVTDLPKASAVGVGPDQYELPSKAREWVNRKRAERA